MLRSDWGIFAAIGAVAALLALGWITEPRQPFVSSLGANPSAVSEPADAQQQARIICDGKCDLTFGGGALTAPSANEDQPEEKQTSGTPSQVEVDDLWTQRRMAHWALFTALMAGFGVMGVLWTLKTAQDANKGFRESAEAQLRAYVAFTGLEDEQRGASGTVYLRPKWKNTGSTPTRHLATNGGYAFLDGPIPADFDYADKQAKHGRFSLGGNVEEQVNGPILDGTELGPLLTGKRLYVWGWAEYGSVFSKRRYRTEFCVHWILRPDGSRAVLVHGPHNGTDDECLKPLQTDN